MTEKTEALRLADELEEAAGEYWRFQKSTGYGAAAELRRLSIENEALGLHLSKRMKDLARVETQRDALLEALKRYVDHLGDPLKCARAAIAKAEEA